VNFCTAEGVGGDEGGGSKTQCVCGVWTGGEQLQSQTKGGVLGVCGCVVGGEWGRKGGGREKRKTQRTGGAEERRAGWLTGKIPEKQQVDKGGR